MGICPVQEGLEDLAAKGFSDQRNARNEEVWQQRLLEVVVRYVVRMARNVQAKSK